MKHRRIDFNKLKYVNEGAHGSYYKLSKTLGVKIIESTCLCSDSTLSDAKDALRGDVVDEFKCLQKAYKRNKKLVPRPVELAIIVDDRDGFKVGYVVQHLNGKTLYKTRMPKKKKHEIVNKLYGKLASSGIFHGDLHLDNVIVSNKRYYAIDFDQDFISFDYFSARDGWW